MFSVFGMARTRRYRPWYIPCWNRNFQLRDLKAKDCRIITQKWIDSVVIGLQLCPFAQQFRHQFQSKIVVSTAFLLDQQLQAVTTEAEALKTIDPSAPFCSTLIVLPHLEGQTEPFYRELLKHDSKLFGSVDEANSQCHAVQAIPFESCTVNRGKAMIGAAVDPITAMAPFPTIQLIRYSDFAKIPETVRRRIMMKNDTVELQPTSRLELVEDCFRGHPVDFLTNQRRTSARLWQQPVGDPMAHKRVQNVSTKSRK